MVTLFIRHTVSDYQAWRKAYDDFAPTQQVMGVTAQAVYRGIANPNDVTVTHEFANLATAQVFLMSEELKQAMQSTGVADGPTVWFTTRV